MSKPNEKDTLRPIVVHCSRGNLDHLLTMEWLRSNRLGSYSSSTVVGCNVRRYHGLLVAATRPPVQRIVALATVMEQVEIDGQLFDLACNEFPGTFSPEGHRHLMEFRDAPVATYVFGCEGVRLTKRVILHPDQNAVLIRYEVKGHIDRLILRPFTPMRDFHALRSAEQGQALATEPEGKHGLLVRDTNGWNGQLHLTSNHALYHDDPQWWYRMLYRIDLARGQEAQEDLFSPGRFVWEPGKKKSCKLVASLGEPAEMKYKSTVAAVKVRQAECIRNIQPAPRAVRRLAAATDNYIVSRPRREGQPGASVLAGFPWFADWGRDTFIALPGLLLTTKRYELARHVFATYAEALRNGMVPNRFDDYGREPHYNSIDASLWFVIAAHRYLSAVRNDTDNGDERHLAESFWREVLRPACDEILRGYASGTDFHIHTVGDGLLVGGGRNTQLTWMDAKLGEQVITSRWGKAVEINALWHSAHRILAEHARKDDPQKARNYAHTAEVIAESFRQTFWNEQVGWLNDCVNDDGVDASLRPNQLLAVSLPHSPLTADQQKAVVDICRKKLLTPLGLRSLSPDDPRYRRRYGGSWESRERAYHQGTVWAWLIGPFIEAYLQVEGATTNPPAVKRAQGYLAGFDGHLNDACLGQVSEIFDGDPPHTPRGCCAQAWSVAEVLRARQLVKACEAS